MAASGGLIRSGFSLCKHELVTIRPPASTFNYRKNTLAFYHPRFPDERDPYVHIHEPVIEVK